MEFGSARGLSRAQQVLEDRPPADAAVPYGRQIQQHSVLMREVTLFLRQRTLWTDISQDCWLDRSSGGRSAQLDVHQPTTLLRRPRATLSAKAAKNRLPGT